MRSIRKKISQTLSKVVIQGSVAFFTMLCGVQSVIADVVPTTNSAATGTAISQPTTGRFDILGGTTSDDGTNLFHGFSQFDLDDGEIANFIIIEPQINNVISYITGAPSTIDGGLQVLGSDANLYLINPSGILFGPNVSLFLPGHFTAATATDLEFGDQWLNLNSSPAHTIDYSVLSGEPTAFGFSLDSPIVNLGDLRVSKGRSLSLLGGTVVNTGTLSASEGNITITAIEQGDLLRINHAGSLVSLEVAATTNSGLTASSLSALLTGAPAVEVNTLTINPDNTVSLTSTNTLIPERQGSTIASGVLITSGTTGGNINLFGRRVGTLDANLAVRGFQDSGKIRVGGDRSIDRDYTARFVYVDDGTALNASAFDFGTGNGGNVTLRASDSTQFYGSIETHGSTLGGNGGNVAILGNRDLTYDGTVDLSAPRGNAGQLLLRTLNIDIENGPQINMPVPPTTDIFASPSLYKTTLYENTLEQFSNLELRSRHNIVIKSLTDDGALAFQPGGSILFATDVDNNAGGGFSMRSQDTLYAPGSNVTITAGSSSLATLVGNILTESTDPSVPGTSGNVEILAQDLLFASTLNAGDGDISIKGNGIEFLGGAGSITADAVSISPRDSDININIGDASAANTLELGNRDIEALNGNINRLLIGATDGTGQILLSDAIATNTNNSFTTSTFIQGNIDNPEAVSLVGPNLSTTWTITGRNSGTLSNYEKISFSDIANIVGGNADDTFVFATETAQIEQLIDGKAGTLTFLGDSIELAESIEGTGDLFIQPQTAGRIIHLNRADNVQNTLSITAEEFSGLRGDFTSLEIGRSDSGRLTLTGNGSPSGNFTLRSGAEIDAIASSLFGNTEGASINLIAGSDISIGNLSTQGGDINLISPGSITTGYLNAAGTNTGGNITVTTDEFFRATGGIDNDGSGPSLATSASGQITLTHGGNGRTPFTIGDNDQNGTAGSVTTQSVTQTSGLFYRNFVDSSDSIRILTNADPLPPEPPTEPTTPQTPQLSLLTPQLEDSSNSEFGTVILSSSDTEDAEKVLGRIESSSSNNFLQQLDTADRSQQTKVATLSQIQKTLSQARQNLSIQPSLLYVYFVPDAATSDFNSSSPPAASPNDQLEIMLVTPDGQPIKRRQWGVTRAQVEEAATELRHQVTSQFSMPQSYLKPGQQLYDWLVRPIQAELATEGTDNLAFVLAEGLRTIPIAAIHDGEQFLVESYSLGIMPTFSLTQLDTEPLNAEAPAEDHPENHPENHRVLAMGASRFENQSALPAVEAELQLIAERNQASRTFLNEDFTLENLSAQIASNQYGIVHLATHANFESGDLDGSYIQLWNERINLNTLKDLSLSETDIALIILSACNTAMGDRSSEYGFAGFAISAGSESALASLWPVSDEGTLGFMTQFYDHYADRATRSEALRQAQINMLSGQVRIFDGHIKNAENTTLATIPQLAQSGNWDFSHPYYWSAFTMIGNPW